MLEQTTLTNYEIGIEDLQVLIVHFIMDSKLSISPIVQIIHLYSISSLSLDF